MFNAVEARMLSDGGCNLVEILDKIKERAKSGRYSLVIGESIDYYVKEKLERLGFKIQTYTGENFDIYHPTITW